MIIDQKHKVWPINQLFLLLATLSVVFAVLKSASELIVPFLISIAIAILLSPLFSYMETKKIPKIVSLIALTLVVLIPIVSLGGYIAGEVQDFIRNYHTMQKQFDAWLYELSNFASEHDFNVTKDDLSQALSLSNFSELIQGLALQTKNQFSNIFLIFFIVAFMLMESTSFYNKLLKTMNERGGDMAEAMKTIAKIKDYFIIKSKTSLLTAVWVLAVLWFYDIRYPMLWATLAFFLNFIPVIGSILAAVPAVIMALVDHSLMTSVWIAVWYVLINVVVGNILEPRIMGKGLGISALVIFLSMTFWGWIFGPAGMILSVPLTMGLQYLFDQYEETKWVALMLSDYEKEQ